MTARFDASTKLYISAAAQPGNFGTKVYNALFERHGLNSVYLSRRFVEAKPLIDSVRAMGLAGCSVSMPLKSRVIPFLDDLEPLATRLQSVNTIVNRNGRLCGFNTDYVGARAVLEGLQFKSVLIYGSGSVAQTVSCVLQDLGVNEVSVCARAQEKAQALASQYSWRLISNPLDSQQTFDLVINVTPASKEAIGHDIYRFLERTQCIFDLVVSQTPTPWVAAAQNRKLNVVTGLTMFFHQLIRQFNIYTDETVTVEEIQNIVRG